MPMYFLQPPTEGFCEAQVGWHIEEGHLDGVDLVAEKLVSGCMHLVKEKQRILPMVAGS
ncbi:MAG: hypothetical protein CM15mP93_14150 [Thiotrichaceae bacterium]|nr:MAG: hypothetical protein CM15mP93_14150 [Thiotrichaceae bacterium]